LRFGFLLENIWYSSVI